VPLSGRRAGRPVRDVRVEDGEVCSPEARQPRIRLPPGSPGVYSAVRHGGERSVPTALERGCSSVVERHVANVNVVSSNLITRLVA
jgi:hypothetical protein